jgi:hypothetical protein
MGPDLIVLDFSGNAETVERLKGDARTMSIPLIGLVDTALAREVRGRAAASAPSRVTS